MTAATDAVFVLLVCVCTAAATGVWFPGGDKPKPTPEPQPETVPVLDAFVAELFATIRRRAVQRHPGSPS